MRPRDVRLKEASSAEAPQLNSMVISSELNISIKIKAKLGSKTAKKFTSVQFSCSVVSDSLRLRESQHTRPPCPSTPRVYPNPCP